MCRSTISTAFILGTIVTACVAGTAREDEATLHRLWDTLLKGYDASLRPVTKDSNITNVTLQVFPLHLIDLDEERGILKFYGQLVMTWNDLRLTWKKENFSGISFMNLRNERLWKPDIIIFSSQASDYKTPNETHLRVHSSGMVVWAPPVIADNFCPTDLTDYPGDRQRCTVTLGCRSHHGEEVDLKPFGNRAAYRYLNRDNLDWEVVGWESKRVVRQYEYKTFKEPQVQVETTFTLQRKFPFPLRVAWGPSLTSLLLTLTMFWAPAHSEKKLLVGTFAFLVLAVLVVYVATSGPSAVGGWKAVRPLHNTLYAITSAVLIEALVVSLTRISGPTRPPQLLVRPLYGVPGRALGLCFARPPTKVGDRVQLREDSDETLTPDDELTPEEEWKLLATAVDRVLFTVYVVTLAVVHKGS